MPAKKKEKKSNPENVPPRSEEQAAAEPEPESCPIVGFGASAGGLEAMTEVLRELPDDTGMAIVFVQHLDPKHASMLSELLLRETAMPVQQVNDSVAIQGNHVYVIAPNTLIAVRKGGLYQQPRDPNVPNMPIDFFFRSLAEDQGSKAIGVVLSGTASDGTLGLKAIKEAGGIALAQDPDTAKYDGMPRSSILAGCVDTVLSTKGIAAELVRLCNHTYIATGPREEVTQNDKAFDDVLSQVRQAKGVDFTHYKPGTVRRRMLRRMAIHRIDTPEEYGKYLRSHREAMDQLFNDLLIRVTNFFRESATFKAVSTQVLPAIMKNRSREDPVRVWVPGCSTGEEAYSVAICILEYLRQAGLEVSVQLFGTDLSETALEQARSATYPASIEADVSPDRLRRFFVPTNGMYQIARSVRDMCVFARQNVTKDPPFSKLDLITCRNLLIYLGQPLQARVMRLFHYALKPNGFLVLGTSETIGGATDLFAPLDRQHKIYSRKPAPAMLTNDFEGYEEQHHHEPARQKAISVNPLDPERRVDQLLLASYSPPAIVIDADLRVLHFRGDTSRYLQNTPGAASLSLTKLARGTMAAEIRRLLDSPEIKQGKAVKTRPIALTDEPRGNVALCIRPLEGAPERRFLIVFEEVGEKPATRSAKLPPPGKPSVLAARVTELEDELAGTKRYLHSVIEEQEAATEELKSAHEEVQSSNEELQSTNEELLTAKEELQSANEELTTVNDEMQSRNTELQQINNDLMNLLGSVNIPIVMLGNDLKIRRFTPQAEKILNLLASDTGRPLSDFRLKINLPDLVDICHSVIDTLAPRDREVEDTDGRLYSMWVRPYRTADNRIDGVVLALFDITERKLAAEARYRRLFEASKDGIVIADVESGEIVDANPFITKLFGYPRSRLVGAKYWESDLFRDSEVNESLMAGLHEQQSVQMSPMLMAESGERVAVDINASAYTEGQRTVIQFNIRDISARKRMEEQLNRNQEELRETQKMEAVGRLAAGVAHDFNNILTAVVGYSDLLRDETKENARAQKWVDQVRGATDRAISLTRQLLAFGRKQIVRPDVLDVNAVIGEMRQMLAVTMPKNVELELKLEPDLGHVCADRSQLEQVILSLALNARDAMPEGGTLTVGSANVDADQEFAEQHPTVPAGNYVSITVRDTGMGMDRSTQAHMFEPFFTTKAKGAGVGLGLSTVYGIVKQTGGYILAYSEMGIGTTFTVYFPRVEAEPAPAESEKPEFAQAKGTETILLVEDENAVRELARRFLEMRGYRVMDASNGPEALRISRAHQGKIDLLLTDVVMARMSGREVALQLAPERPDMKVLYMSGHTEDAIVHHGVLKEGVEFLQKPFTQEQLVSRVRRILDGKSTMSQPGEERRADA